MDKAFDHSLRMLVVRPLGEMVYSHVASWVDEGVGIDKAVASLAQFYPEANQADLRHEVEIRLTSGKPT